MKCVCIKLIICNHDNILHLMKHLLKIFKLGKVHETKTKVRLKFLVDFFLGVKCCNSFLFIHNLNKLFYLYYSVQA